MSPRRGLPDIASRGAGGIIRMTGTKCCWSRTVATTAMRTIADVLARLGDIPADRIRLDPRPGTATAEDTFEVKRREGKLCEVIDGVLVEKPMDECSGQRG